MLLDDYGFVRNVPARAGIVILFGLVIRLSEFVKNHWLSIFSFAESGGGSADGQAGTMSKDCVLHGLILISGTLRFAS
jgi:hypothetical protein